jgi:hypothetical protein
VAKRCQPHEQRCRALAGSSQHQPRGTRQGNFACGLPRRPTPECPQQRTLRPAHKTKTASLLQKSPGGVHTVVRDWSKGQNEGLRCGRGWRAARLKRGGSQQEGKGEASFSNLYGAACDDWVFVCSDVKTFHHAVVEFPRRRQSSLFGGRSCDARHPYSKTGRQRSRGGALRAAQMLPALPFSTSHVLTLFGAHPPPPLLPSSQQTPPPLAAESQSIRIAVAAWHAMGAVRVPAGRHFSRPGET